MKKLNLTVTVAFVAVIALITSLQSCSKIKKDLLRYDLKLETGSVQVIILPTKDSALTATGMIHFNVDSFIKANTQNLLGVGNISSAKVTSCTLTLGSEADENNNFANFQTAYVSMYSSSFQEPYTLNVPSNSASYATSLSLPVDENAELKQYFTGDSFTNTVGGRLRKPISKTIKCTVNFSFLITVEG